MFDIRIHFFEPADAMTVQKTTTQEEPHTQLTEDDVVIAAASFVGKL